MKKVHILDLILGESYLISRKWLPNPNKTTTDELLKWKKPALSKAVQFITGFNNMKNCTGHRVKGDTKCRLCQEGDETGVHLAWECKETTHIPEEWTTNDLKLLIEEEKIKYLTEKRQ